MLINNSHYEISEEAINLGNNATAFQAEVFAVGRAAVSRDYLIDLR